MQLFKKNNSEFFYLKKFFIAIIFIQILNLYINLYILLLIIKKKLIFFRKNKLN